jgi:hypothetical protein
MGPADPGKMEDGGSGDRENRARTIPTSTSNPDPDQEQGGSGVWCVASGGKERKRSRALGPVRPTSDAARAAIAAQPITRRQHRRPAHPGNSLVSGRLRKGEYSKYPRGNRASRLLSFPRIAVAHSRVSGRPLSFVYPEGVATCCTCPSPQRAPAVRGYPRPSTIHFRVG